MIRILDSNQVGRLLARKAARLTEAEAVVRPILEAVRIAAANIRAYAKRQMPRAWMHRSGGMRLGQIVRPLDSVAAYIPAGRYPLPSTLLMTVVPAEVAGVRAISVASPRVRTASRIGATARSASARHTDLRVTKSAASR